MSVDLRTLEIAAAVAECGSMSEAGVRFSLTQSAVSQAVKRVETTIGAPLLVRERRPMAATTAGRALVAQMRELRSEVERVIAATRAAAVLPERLEVRFGFVDSFAGTIGALFVRELIQGSMTLRLTAWSGLAFSHTEALVRHAIDATVTSDPMEGLTTVTRYPVFREPFVLVVPRSLATSLRDRDLRDVLARQILVRHSARSHMGQQIERHLSRLQLDPPTVLEFDTSDTLLAMVSTGVGVAITTPLCVMQGASHISSVEIMPLPGPRITRDLILATRRGELPSIGVRMAEQLRALMRDHAMPQMEAFIPWLASADSGLKVHDG